MGTWRREEISINKSLAIEDKLFYYIKKKYDREIPPVKIDKYINGLYTELLSSN